MKHRIDLPDRPKINVYGCGGTGSHVLLGLPRAHKAITDLGGQGFHVNAYDPDKVEMRNIGRQAFTQCEVGVHKSHALVDRINMFHRFSWNSHPTAAPSWSHADIIISCVDTGRSRRQIAESTMHGNPYIIDCGNAKYSGQVVIGQHKGELTDPYKENPELMVEDTDDAPTCGDPYSEQDLFINQIIATYALDFLWTLLHCEFIEKRGVFVDLKKGITNPLS